MFSHLHRSGVCAAHNDSIRRFSGYISGDIIWEATCGDNIKSQAAYRTGVFWIFFSLLLFFSVKGAGQNPFPCSRHILIHTVIPYSVLSIYQDEEGKVHTTRRLCCVHYAIPKHQDTAGDAICPVRAMARLDLITIEPSDE